MFLISVIILRVRAGVNIPTVSGTSKKSAPALTTSLNISNKNSRSVLVPSSAENSTVKPWSFAYSTVSTAESMISSFDFLSL